MKILVVDDEVIQRDLLKGFLVHHGHDVKTAEDGESALRLFNEFPFQLVLLDHKMPDMAGDEVLARIKKVNPFVKSILITAYGSVETAVKVMKLGADDFLEKPVNLESLLEKIMILEQSAMIDEDAASVADEIDHLPLPLTIIGSSKQMRDVLSLVRRIAPTPWPVLIKGETGTGKELIARLIHLLSDRKNGPFIEVNCAAIPETLFESELFGHEKGAFTGAHTSRRGRFELADGGTIFLDEIGDLPHHLQAKLLRVLQEKKVNRVGSETDIEVNVRVFAATNRDLKKMVESDDFREDLYYRLKVLEIEIPALRDRKNDIPELVSHFIAKFGPRQFTLDPEALSMIVKYSFPGNVRELEHIIQRTVTLTRGNIITVRDFPEEIRYYQASEEGVLSRRLESVEREMLLSALEKNDWVQTAAAGSLGISERVLRYKMKKFGIKNRNKE